eukprot:763100-Hanusia_phi.AAC.7
MRTDNFYDETLNEDKRHGDFYHTMCCPFQCVYYTGYAPIKCLLLDFLRTFCCIHHRTRTSTASNDIEQAD